MPNPDLLPQLLEALLAGLGEEPLWGTFLSRLREGLGADYTSIVFRPIPVGQPQSRVVHLFSGADWPPLIAAAYREGGYQDDPLPYFALAEGRPYRLGELLTAGDPAHEDYRRRMLEPSGMNVMRLVRIGTPGGDQRLADRLAEGTGIPPRSRHADRRAGPSAARRDRRPGRIRARADQRRGRQ